MSTRTMFEVLDEAECRRLLAEQEVGRVAFAASDGFPIVLPVNYVVDGDVIALRTESGAKADHLPLHRVAFEVDGLERWNESGGASSSKATGRTSVTPSANGSRTSAGAASPRGRPARRIAGSRSTSTGSADGASSRPRRRDERP
jgi:nitroimidazol reductase NimA-like FMN-containing flavoprotein (pyridoxamine 5'-phosphate oxidase superfamily)